MQMFDIRATSLKDVTQLNLWRSRTLCSASFLQVFREITKAEFFFIIIIVTLEEFYNIFQNIKFKYI